GSAAVDRHVRGDAVESRYDIPRNRSGRGDYRGQSADVNQAGGVAQLVGSARRSAGDAGAWTPRDLGCVGFAPQRAEGNVTSRSVTVVNRLGIHARAAAKFVHVATRFGARVSVARDGREVDGKSIMGILLLAAARGTTILITADGADETSAIEALAA